MTKVECPFCEYEWKYGGALLMASCPSCRRAVDVEDNQVNTNA